MFVKFIEVKTNIKSNDIYTISDSNRDRMKKIYSKFEFVDFVDINGDSSMFCVIHENYMSELFRLLSELTIGFTYKDLTKDILFGFVPNEKDLKFETEYEKSEYHFMIDNFINSYLDVDTVLDKILEHGKSSLTDKDISVLQKA